jgi:transcriptional regulator with XRE-family HTH domain
MEFKDQLREAMGDMTQEQLEELSGIPQPDISGYLRGRLPGYKKLVALERVLPRLRELRDAVEANRAS